MPIHHQHAFHLHQSFMMRAVRQCTSVLPYQGDRWCGFLPLEETCDSGIDFVAMQEYPKQTNFKRCAPRRSFLILFPRNRPGRHEHLNRQNFLFYQFHHRLSLVHRTFRLDPPWYSRRNGGYLIITYLIYFRYSGSVYWFRLRCYPPTLFVHVLSSFFHSLFWAAVQQGDFRSILLPGSRLPWVLFIWLLSNLPIFETPMWALRMLVLWRLLCSHWWVCFCIFPIFNRFSHLFRHSSVWISHHIWRGSTRDKSVHGWLWIVENKSFSRGKISGKDLSLSLMPSFSSWVNCMRRS